jgi:glycosyltransferase involved in cell wall biosynthesis
VSPLRILHVVPYYEQAWAYGGIPRLAAAMTRALARRRHHVTVCTTDACDDASRLGPAVPGPTDVCGSLDVRVFRNVSNRLAYHCQFFTPIGLSAYLRRTASSFDIAHLHACHNLPGAIAARVLGLAGIPYVISPNGTAPAIERRVIAKRIFSATAGRHVLRDAARVLAVTESERHQLIALGVDRTRIAIVPNPIDDEEFERTPRDDGGFRRGHGLEERPIVLFLGKLTPRKGVDVLLHAFGRLRPPEAVLVIAGNDMGAGTAAHALARRLGLADRVIRTGLLRGEERLGALRAADVVAYPSRDEVFGLVPLEAVCCGTPVVVCNDSGCGEVIARLGGGLTVPPGDPPALARGIQSVLDAPDAWRDRVAVAAGRARALFGADVVAAQLERVYWDVQERAQLRRESA